MKLNIGSNRRRVAGYTNLDGQKLGEVDIVHDLTKFPYPFEENSIEDILMIEVLEHITFRKTQEVLKELYRILKPEGRLYIQVPDCGSMMRMYLDDKIGEEMPHKVPYGMKNNDLLDIANKTGKWVHPTRWLMAFCGAQKPYNGEDYFHDIHKNIFTTERLEDDLMTAGFSRIDFGVDPLGWKIKVNCWK